MLLSLGSLVPVNEFQQQDNVRSVSCAAQEFQRLGLKRRDPMFLTMATLLEAP